MNAKTILSILAATVLAGSVSFAQDDYMLTMKFRAQVRTTSTTTGKAVVKVITEEDIIRNCARGAGLGTTNLSRFLLVYHVKADYNGDRIQVVRRSDKGVVCEPFKVLFQESIVPADSRRDDRFGFIFNTVGTDAKGSVIVTEKPFVRADGTLGGNQITGKFQMLDDMYFPENKAIMSGYFITGKQF